MVLGFGQKRGLGNCFIPSNDQMPQHCVAKLECRKYFIQRTLIALDIH